MDKLVNLIEQEPALVIGFVDAALVLAVTFGIHISGDQKIAVDGFLTAALAIAAALLTRSQVVPKANVAP